MRQRIVAVLPVVVADTGCSHSTVWHGLNKQENIRLIYRAATERKGLQHAVDHLLVAAENVSGEGFGKRLDLLNKFSKVGISENRQKRPENLVLHDFVGPGNGVEDSRVEITGLRVGLPTVNNLLGIDQGCKPFDSGGTNDTRVIRITLGNCAIKLDDSFLAFPYEFFCHGLMDDCVAG